MPLGTYYVESTKYIGPPPSVRVIPKKIASEDIKSNKLDEPGHARPNVTSYPWGEYKPDFIQIDNKVYAVTRTSAKRYLTLATDFLQNGPITHNDDYGIERWNFAGKDNYSSRHGPIPKMPDIAYITGITPVPMHLDIRSTPVNLRTTPRIVEAVDPNKLGYYESKKANLYQLLRGVLFDEANRLNDTPVAWIDFLANKGFSIETSKNAEIIALAIQKDVEKEGYLAFYYPRLGILGVEKDFYDNAKKIAAAYGLTEREAIEEMMRADILHEFGHRFGIRGDAASERLQGLLRNEFYTMLTANFKGTKWERIYRALAQEGADYARAFSPLNVLWDRITAKLYPDKIGPLELLLANFEAVANALELSGEERKAYIIRRIEETYGEILGTTPSFNESLRSKSNYSENKTSKSHDKKFSARKKGLEALIERLREEARALKVDEGEYISKELARNPKKYVEDADEAETDSKYERKINKSNYKNMKDVKERETKSEKTEEAKEAAESPSE